MTSTLSIAGLSAGYPGKMVINDLSVPAIGAGRLAVLVGPNGAGKSTLLRAVAGLLPARGSIRHDDRELVGAPLRERARRITFMPQSLPQQIGLTVFEAMLSALKSSPVEDLSFANDAALHDRVMSVLERVGIAGLAMRGLDHLSGGERQLASLAQAVVREPRILLLDEPTSALDLRHQVSVMSLVRDFARDGRLVLAVLHDLNLAASWADHVIVLRGGQVDSEGLPIEAITPTMLARVYGVRAMVDSVQGRPRITIDGLV